MVSRLLHRCVDDVRGNVALVFALALLPIMAAVGCAIDGVRWYNAMNKTTAAVDSALLSGARAMQLDGANEAAALDTARRVYASNVAARTQVDSDTVDFELVDGKKAMSVTGDAFLKTSFLSIVGKQTLSLVPPGKAKASFVASGNNKGSDIEISLMLDVTGSMCNDGSGPCTSGTKIDGVKAAAQDLVNIVIEDTPSPSYVSRVALVPFSTRVRLESASGDGSLMKAATNLDPTWTGYYRECTAGSGTAGSSTETNGTWVCTQEQTSHVTWQIYPCVTERIYGSSWDSSDTVDYTDAAPGTDKWINAHGGNRDVLSWDSTDSNYPTDYDGKTSATPSYNWNYGPGRWCEDVPEANTIMPLTSDKAALSARIANLEAGGATAGALGVAWTWYTISPNWDQVFKAPSKPGSYSDLTTKQASGAPKLRKVAVLMSDGVFNALRGQKDQPPAQVSAHAKKLCENMKATGIEVYSVAFDLESLSASDRAIAEEVMTKCATDLSHFYSTLTVNDLKTAFRDIALKTSPVRLTQ